MAVVRLKMRLGSAESYFGCSGVSASQHLSVSASQRLSLCAPLVPTEQGTPPLAVLIAQLLSSISSIQSTQPLQPIRLSHHPAGTVPRELAQTNRHRPDRTDCTVRTYRTSVPRPNRSPLINLPVLRTEVALDAPSHQPIFQFFNFSKLSHYFLLR
jgi:hypothetical protein